MGLGLVLGAGGTVGMAYHCGVLKALEDEAGIVPDHADLIVGTSAGSVVAAYLRSGFTTDDLWALAHDPEGLEDRRSRIFSPAWATGGELARRGIGSAFVLARSVVRGGPVPPVPRPLGRLFPAGLYRMAEGETRFAEDLPAGWPAKPTWICAVDIVTGRRVVLGRAGSPETDLSRAVMASCAIPGVYPPVGVGDMTLVDGGARSTTNLDLAAKFGCELIIGVAPMAYDPASPPPPGRQLGRRVAARSLAAEVSLARRAGAEVLLVRPTAAELRHHGRNLMRADSGERIVAAAYEATARLLTTDRFRRALAA